MESIRLLCYETTDFPYFIEKKTRPPTKKTMNKIGLSIFQQYGFVGSMISMQN